MLLPVIEPADHDTRRSAHHPATEATETAGMAPDVVTALAALRAAGAGDVDALQLNFIEVLARRAAQQPAPVRQRLQARLTQAIDKLAARCTPAQAADEPLSAPPSAPTSDTPAAASVAAAPSPLAALLRHIDAHNTAQGMADGHSPSHPSSGRPEAGELKTVRYFRTTWSRLSVDKQVTQAIRQGPENAGPLNSHLLVLRSLELMRDQAPDYLSRFMCYVDTLLSLDAAEKDSRPAPKKAGRAKAGRR